VLNKFAYLAKGPTWKKYIIQNIHIIIMSGIQGGMLFPLICPPLSYLFKGRTSFNLYSTYAEPKHKGISNLLVFYQSYKIHISDKN